VEEADRQQDNLNGSEQQMGRQAVINAAQHLQRSTSRKRRQGGEPDRQVVKPLMDMPLQVGVGRKTDDRKPTPKRPRPKPNRPKPKRPIANLGRKILRPIFVQSIRSLHPGTRTDRVDRFYVLCACLWQSPLTPPKAQTQYCRSSPKG
jgi:hypothetical protein